MQVSNTSNNKSMITLGAFKKGKIMLTKTQEIVSYKLSVTWSDGKVEGLGSVLPEYLDEELQIYFRELEDLREEYDNDMRGDEEYTFNGNVEKTL